VRQLQNDIAETEHIISAKQTKIDKLKGELETLKEQTRKQNDTLGTIKAAWEKAEAEAKAFEASIQNNK
jgi:chromosome segregation ATPase